MSRGTIAKLEAAGYIVIQVNSFESVKAIDGFSVTSLSLVTESALKAVVNSGYDSVTHRFGKAMANALLGPQIQPK